MKTHLKIRTILAVCLSAGLVVSCAEQPSTSGNSIDNSAFYEKIRAEKVISSPQVSWKNFGPGMSGYNEKFWTHPTDSDVMFMGPDMHVSFGSWDNGKSWQTIKDSDGLGHEMRRVLDIEFSMQNPDLGMAIDWNGWAYQTTDKGRSWTKIKELGRSYKDVGIDPNDPESFNKGWYYEQLGTRHSELAVDPTDDNIWYVGAGDFWDVKANHKSKAKPHGIRFKFADYGYIWKTADKGNTWTKITNGLPADLEVARIIVNPNNNQQLTMASSHGLMLSSDGGLSWEAKAKGLPNNLPRDLTSYYNAKTGEFVLYLIEQTVFEEHGNTVISKGGVYTSTDAGNSWNNITGNLEIDLTQISSPAEHQRFYKTIGYWFGIPRGKAQNQFSQLPKAILPVFNRVVVNPLNKNEIYLSYNKKHDRTFGPGDLWRSVNGGKTWKAVARYGEYWNSAKDTDYWESRGNPIGANMTFAHLHKYMQKNTEYSGNRMLAINNKGDLFIGIDQQTLKSSNKGDTWEQVDDFETSPGSKKWVGRGASDLPGRVMLHETGIKGRRLLASGEHGVWQTTDFDGWENKQDVVVEQIEGQNQDHGMHSISTLAVHPKDPNTLYILAWRQNHRGNLRKSTDGGKTWENISTILEAPKGVYSVAAQNSLTIDPVNPNNMYFITTYNRVSEIHNGPGKNLGKGGYGFYRSTDGGYTWALSNQGLHDGVSLRRMTIHPNNPEVFYAAANDDDGGLYRSDDKGSNWKKISIPTEIKSVNNVFIDRNNQDILISAGRNNGSYKEGGVWRSKDDGKTWKNIFKAPYVWQAETSPVDSNLIVISVAGQIASMSDNFMNPGVYLSRNSGDSWTKINKNLTHPSKITDVKPDPYNKNVLWCSTWGSGWFIAYLDDSKESWLKN